MDKKRLKKFKTDVGKIRERASGFSSGKFWNSKPGVSRIRILPPWNDEGIFYKEVVFHYGFQIQGKNRAFPCLKSLGEKRCPACQLVARYAEESDSDIKSIIQKMKPKGKWFMNIVDRKGDAEEVKIFGAPYSVARDILVLFSDPDYGDLTDPEEGRDIIIEREGTGFTTRYSTRPGAIPTPLGLENWQELLNNLDTDVIREQISGKKMLELLEELYGDTLDLKGITYSGKKAIEEPEEEEEEAPKKKVHKEVEEEEVPVKKSPKKKVQDEDDDDLGTDDDE